MTTKINLSGPNYYALIIIVNTYKIFKNNYIFNV